MAPSMARCLLEDRFPRPSHPAWRPLLPIPRTEPRSWDHCLQIANCRKIVGGVISPLLANVYLHCVLDVWFEREVKPRLRGRAFLIRYADDFVMGFACEEDARQVLDVLPKRFGRYGLTLHPDKTRLVPFCRP